MFSISSSAVAIQPIKSVEVWFQHACHYDDLKNRILRNECQGLSSDELSFLAQFIVRNGTLHQAIMNQDDVFAKKLIEIGADINALDAAGKPPIAFARSSEMMSWLLANGAHLNHDYRVLDDHILTYCDSRIYPETYQSWLTILPIILRSVNLKYFTLIQQSKMEWLIKLTKTNAKVADVVMSRALQFVKEYPLETLKIVMYFIEHNKADYQDYLEKFAWLIKSGCISDVIIEKILTDPDSITYSDDVFNKIYQAIQPYWTPSPKLKSWMDLCSVREACYYFTVLSTTSLQETAELLSEIKKFPSTQLLPAEIKKDVVTHIIHQQIKEKTSFWIVLEDCSSIAQKDICQMLHLGCDPTWVEPKFNRNFAFSRKAWLLTEEQLKNEKVITALNHRDICNNNPLEHHCQSHPFFRALSDQVQSIMVLSQLGLKLREGFPNLEKSRKFFPENPLMQACLVACLIHPKKHFLERIKENIPKDQQNVFIHSLEEKLKQGKDLDVCNVLSKISYSYRLLKNPIVNFDLQKFASEDLSSLLRQSALSEYVLAELSNIWEGKVPSEALKLIPESPHASLSLSAIEKQHTARIRGKKVVRPQKLFLSLSHNDYVHFNRYIFEHPEFMRYIVEDYMKVKEVAYQYCGRIHATHAKFVEHAVLCIKKLLHVPTEYKQCNDTQKKIVDAFKARVPPIPLETFYISNNSKIKPHGRTILVKNGKTWEGLKFLKEGEKYDHFSQEHSVSNVVNSTSGIFKSEFLKPIAVYAVKKLPSILDPYKDSLPAEQTTAYIFHYQAEEGKFKYLQNLSPEQYLDSRAVCLHDAVKFIKMGIYPDLAALFHNKAQDRRYILLVDLLAALIRRSHKPHFQPAGGAGRLDQPFPKIQYPNMCATGLTDLRDVSRAFGKDKIERLIKDTGELNKYVQGWGYYMQLEALSRTLLVDMLILAERYRKLQQLRWQDEEAMQRFGLEIGVGLAHVIAAYADQTHEKSLVFVKECGIDWKLVARQIAFWMDNSPTGYPTWISQGKVPEGIFEKHTDVIVDPSKAKNFDIEQGCKTNAEQDIGLYNGPLAFTEFEKAMHLLFNCIALAEPLSH